MGGLCAVTFAEVLEKEGIRANLVVAIDPRTRDIRRSAERRSLHQYFFCQRTCLAAATSSRRRDSAALCEFRPVPARRVSYQYREVDTIQQQLVTKVLQIAFARGPGDTLPIRYVVPPKEPIELWDSGTFGVRPSRRQLAVDRDRLPRSPVVGHPSQQGRGSHAARARRARHRAASHRAADRDLGACATER